MTGAGSVHLANRPGGPERLRVDRAEQGSATAEVAILLPGIVLLLSFLLASGAGVIAEIRCVDAARAGARLAARGEPAGAVLAAARVAAPSGADVQVAVGGDSAQVRVSAAVPMPLPGAPDVRVHASAVSQLERAL